MTSLVDSYTAANHNDMTDDDAMTSSIDSLDLQASKRAFTMDGAGAKIHQVIQSIQSAPVATARARSHPENMGATTPPRSLVSPFHGSEAPSLVHSEAGMSDFSSVSPRPHFSGNTNWMNVHRRTRPASEQAEDDEMTCSVTTITSIEDFCSDIKLVSPPEDAYERPPNALLQLYLRAVNYIRECWSDQQSRAQMKALLAGFLAGIILGTSVRRKRVDWHHKQFEESVRALRTSFFEAWDVPVSVIPSVL